jgi:hypothetical protein
MSGKLTRAAFLFYNQAFRVSLRGAGGDFRAGLRLRPGVRFCIKIKRLSIIRTTANRQPSRRFERRRLIPFFVFKFNGLPSSPNAFRSARHISCQMHRISRRNALSPFRKQGTIKKMKQRRRASLFASILLLTFSTVALAADEPREDTDTRMTAAEVVEVTDMRISVISRSGIEHVIAIDNSDTKVMLEGNVVSLKDLRKGDIVTVELDEKSPVKFARNIAISLQANNALVARAKP